MENYQGNTNYNLLEDSDIVNNLTTTATNKALSANQGKVLNTNISDLAKHFLIDGNIGLYTSGKATLTHQSNAILSANVTMPSSINNTDYLCLMTIHNVSGSAMYIGNAMTYEISGNNLKLEYGSSGGGFQSGHVVEVAYFVFKRTVE